MASYDCNQVSPNPNPNPHRFGLEPPFTGKNTASPTRIFFPLTNSDQLSGRGPSSVD